MDGAALVSALEQTLRKQSKTGRIKSCGAWLLSGVSVIAPPPPDSRPLARHLDEIMAMQ